MVSSQLLVGYLYIDGESHCIRSEQCWKKLFGPEAKLADVECDSLHNMGYAPPVTQKRERIRVCHEAKFFWDSQVVSHLLVGSQFPVFFTLLRGIYFTALSGDRKKVFEANSFIRQTGFEPQIVQEDRQLEKARANLLNQAQVIEKPKGVDIGLTVRVLEDAHNDNFDCCLLVTSDVDYLPVIEAVRRRGKQVYVLGYPQGLAADSPFHHRPDHFTDLEQWMVKMYRFQGKRWEPAS